MAKKADAEPADDLAIDGEAPKKSKKKLIIIIVISVVLLAVLGAGGFFGYKWWMGKKAAAAGDNATEQKAEAGGHGEAKPAEGGNGEAKPGEGGKGEKAADAGGAELVSLPPILVNLADPQGRRYLKLALDIEVSSKSASDELTKNMPKIKDSLILLLSSKTYDDLASIENKILLKKEIVERLTLVLGEQKVSRVYITEIVIQ
ncbi:MAG: flagellar basal body-associated FliL family protein [Humidesulfovibrio sp.]|uniref:flagellar basal body-associated FliL family protein n=1 Tax=Humidesulfovibrio sp. TaxID=2910988 RepID=UPI0027FC39AD|nr:flagellar basal body-associated FliL family protein [Humidesulfovibrio sp.]MDQ7836479.1 flagellar basal body-associated FliL family protein [Humidesulfovibrio sp.]